MAAADPSVRPRLRQFIEPGIQVVIFGAAWGFYLLCRHLFEGSESTANSHARQIWSLERTLHLPSEARIQSWALGSHTAIQAINIAYEYVHFPAIICTFVLLYVRRREAYRWFRNVLILTTGLALIGHISYPLSPPRLQPALGMVDTGNEFGQTTYKSPPGTGFTNQLAAMPSMHVAWAALIAIAIIVCLRTRWRWLAPIYPFAILMVVVITGNHYWMDGIVGLALLALSILVFWRSRPTRSRIGGNDLDSGTSRPAAPAASRPQPRDGGG